MADTKRIPNFEDLVKQHGYVKARQYLKRTNILTHQLEVQKKEDRIHEALKPQRIKSSLLMSATAGKAPEDSMLEKILKANSGVTALELAAHSGDLLTTSKLLMQSVTTQDVLSMVKKHEKSLPKQSFVEDDALRYALQSEEQKLLIPNKGYSTLPHVLGETLLMQTAFLHEIHCARNNIQSLLSPDMPQFSTYHIRYVKNLDLSYNKISRLPNNFGNMQLLEVVDLSHNKISKLPPSFLTLKYLNTLNLEGNSFEKLPEELGSLDSITNLDLSSNLFQIFPYPAMRLRNLKFLKLSSNLITHLAVLPPLLEPEDLWIDHIDRRTGQIVQMNVITHEKLVHIELYDGVGIQKAADLHTYQPASSRSYRRRKIWLSVCQIHEWEPVIDGITGGIYYRNNVSGQTSVEMPSCLDTVGNMKNVSELNISRNSISFLPKSFSQLQSLKKLVFTQNRLRELPEDFGLLTSLEHCELTGNALKILPVSICDLPLLKTLLLNDNHLLRLPDQLGRLPKLEALDVSVNRLKQIPSTLGFCETLTRLLAAENPLEDPPIKEFAKGIDQLKWYLRNRYHIQQRGMPPEMQYHPIGINNEIILLKPELMETIEQRIAGAKKDGLLNLQLLGLKDIPSLVLKMPNLRRLKLDFNKQLSFPDGFAKQLKGLQGLSIRGCNLSSIPENVYIFEKLISLNLEENCMENLPEGITEITTLTTLDVSKNRLYYLPEGLQRLKNLKTLNLESNNLDEIPDAISKLSDLKVLNLAKNRLKDLPRAVCKLTNLSVLNVEKNILYFLPDDLRKMKLIELRVGHNRIEKLSPKLFADSLGQTLLFFSCCENNILELPPSMAELSPKSVIEGDYNPLVSPPPHLLTEGTLIIQHYLSIREKRRELLISMLEDEDFELNKNSFNPHVSEALEDGTGFLTPEDLAEFDIAVDEFLNGEYYKCPATAEEIVASIVKLREDRETELYLAIIRTFLKVLGDIKDMPDDRFFNESTFLVQQRPWGRDGELCNVYAVPLSALLRETPPNSFYPDGRPSIFSLVAANLPHISFPFTIDLLKDSIRLYVSPYGIIADTEQVVFPACDCIDPALNNKPKRHDLCTKAAVVIAKSIYVDEEADRREKEEDEFLERFEEIEFNVRIWLMTEEGQKGLSQEVRSRKNILKEEIMIREEMLLSQQYKLRKAKDLMGDLVSRKSLFEEGQGYELHGFQDINEATNKIGKAEEEVELLQERIEILVEMLSDLKGKLNQDYYTFCYQASSDLVQKYCVLGYNAVVLALRKYAAQNDLNRHWDGEDGAAYLDWKSKHTVLPSSAGPGGGDSSRNSSRPASAHDSGGRGMERSLSSNSVNSTSSADTHTTNQTNQTNASKFSVKDTALETEFDWKDTSEMAKFNLKLYARYRSLYPFKPLQ